MARKFREKEWAVMMFIANDNDLGPFNGKKIAEIQFVGSTSAADVIVQSDTLGREIVRRRRMAKMKPGGFVLHEPDPSKVELNTGDKRTLIKFFDSTRNDFPLARRVMLVISNHGTGFSIANDDTIASKAPIFRRGAALERHIASNHFVTANRKVRSTFTGTTADTPATYVDSDALDSIELRDALTTIAENYGHPLEILVLDACLMSTIEIAFQLRRTARFMVASQSNIPVPGCHFTPTFEIMRNESVSTADVARALVDNSVVTQLIHDEHSAMAALDLSKTDAVANAVSALASAMTVNLGTADTFNAITQAHFQARAFIGSESVDLFDFCQKLGEVVQNPVIRAAAKKVVRTIAQCVLRANPRGAAVERARGISILLPKRNAVPDGYGELDFANETAWLAFLEAYLKLRFPPIAAEPPGVVPVPLPLAANA